MNKTLLVVMVCGIGLPHVAIGVGEIDFRTYGLGSGYIKFSNTVAGTWAYDGMVAGLYWGEDAGSVTNLVPPLARLVGPAVTTNSSVWGAVVPSTGGGSRSVGRFVDTYFQVRAWSEGYNSWDDALASGKPEVLISSLSQAPITLARPTFTPDMPLSGIPWGGTAANPIIVDVFSVPEPSVWTWTMLGSVLLFLLRSTRRT